MSGVGPAQCGICGKLVSMTFQGLCRGCFTESMEPDDDEAFDEFDDCGMMPNGYCLKAGSEECDWECGRLR